MSKLEFGDNSKRYKNYGDQFTQNILVNYSGPFEYYLHKNENSEIKMGLGS